MITAKTEQELELLLEFSPESDEIKDLIRKESVMLFEFSDFLKEKYPLVRQEILDERMNFFIRENIKNKGERLQTDLVGCIEEIAIMYAELEGYPHPKCERFADSLAILMTINESKV